MADAELTPAAVLAMARAVERDLLDLNGSPLPVMAVPHLLSSEGSAYFHSYVLAQIIVHQTRAHFLARDGHLLDNARIGADLAAGYWQPGNGRSPFDLVRALTGQAFSPKALAAEIAMSPQAVAARADAAMRDANGKPLASRRAAVDLEADVTIMHGDQLIATTAGGHSWEAVSTAFGSWVRSLGG